MPRNTHILIGEDSPGELFVYEQALRKVGITRYTFVNTGTEIIEYLQAKGEFSNRQKYPFPEWLLLDVRLPRMDGFEVLEWLYNHKECRIIPTIAFSDTDRDEDVRRAYAWGVNAYFVKPTGLQHMVDIIALIDHFWKIAMSPIVHPPDRCD
jgi:CheY-like chemotaxis protein